MEGMVNEPICRVRSKGKIASQNFPIPSKKYAIKPIALMTAKRIMMFLEYTPPLPLKRVSTQEAPVITLDRRIQRAKKTMINT